MAEPKTREQLDKDWWETWWRLDYSWAGLADRVVGGQSDGAQGGLHGEKTLQDYWRRDPVTGVIHDDTAMTAAGELIDCDGTLFHIAHLPPKTKSGAPTPKATLRDPVWDRLDALLAARVAAGAETKTSSLGAPEGLDGRAQLAGTVLRGALSKPQGDDSPLHVTAPHAATLGPAIYAGRRIGAGASFRGAAFFDYAIFDEATFSGDAAFIGAAFAEYTSFDNTAFAGDVVFYGTTFSGYTSLVGANFSATARFENAMFVGDVRFDGSNFSGDVRFEGATFSGEVHFEGSTFSEEAHFRRVVFSESTSFERITFSGVVNFEGATFSKAASFEKLTFPKDALFTEATFSGDVSFSDAVFFAAADFERSVFASRLSFTDVRVEGEARFEGGRCESIVWFNNSQFTQAFQAPYREFMGRTWLNEVVFGGPMSFTGATFEKLVSFEKITWPKSARDWHGAFEAVMFRWPAQFSGAGFKAFAAFDGANLERGIQIDHANEKAANTTFYWERDAAIDAAVLDAADRRKQENDERRGKDRRARLVTRKEVGKYRRRAKEKRLKQLERGCRVLKQAMESASDKSREQMLYRFELQARRAQRGLPPGEKWLSDRYRDVSGYGASIVRPLGALLLLFTLCGLGFFVWGAAAGLVGDGDGQIDALTAFWQALDLSWANIFRPLSALSADVMTEGTLGDRLLNGGPAVAFTVRGAATVQSILAIVLVFLFALAVRRRFQIS